MYFNFIIHITCNYNLLGIKYLYFQGEIYYTEYIYIYIHVRLCVY